MGPELRLPLRGGHRRWLSCRLNQIVSLVFFDEEEKRDERAQHAHHTDEVWVEREQGDDGEQNQRRDGEVEVSHN